MSWFSETSRSWTERLIINVLKCGKIPNHIALIMDGNRRWAQKRHLEKVSGHARGFEKLTETLEWCNEFGIKHVTVYALSVDNLRRPKQEIDGLMALARDKFQQLFDEMPKLHEKGVCIRVFGDLTLLPRDIQQSLAKIVLETEHNNRAHLNVCLAYSARTEIADAMRHLRDGVRKGLLRINDISESVFSACLHSAQTPDPDLLIRTSGENRLSDFLLWQSGHSILAFVDVLWPEFSIWNLFSAIFYFQCHCDGIGTRIARQTEENRIEREFESCDETDFDAFKRAKNARIESFLRYLAHAKRTQLKEMIL